MQGRSRNIARLLYSFSDCVPLNRGWVQVV